MTSLSGKRMCPKYKRSVKLTSWFTYLSSRTRSEAIQVAQGGEPRKGSADHNLVNDRDRMFAEEMSRDLWYPMYHRFYTKQISGLFWSISRNDNCVYLSDASKYFSVLPV